MRYRPLATLLVLTTLLLPACSTSTEQPNPVMILAAQFAEGSMSSSDTPAPNPNREYRLRNYPALPSTPEAPDQSPSLSLSSSTSLPEPIRTEKPIPTFQGPTPW